MAARVEGNGFEAEHPCAQFTEEDFRDFRTQPSIIVTTLPTRFAERAS